MKVFAIAQALIITTPLFTSAPNKILYPNSNQETNIKVKNWVKPTSFKVDKQSSKISWRIKKVAGEHNGNINISNGSFDVENNALKDLALDIDIHSITDADVADKASNDKLIATLKGETIFNSDKYPKANFVTTTVLYKGGSLYNIKGKLTIKGITNEVNFPATVIIDKNKLTASAKISVDRTKYDIKIRSKSFFENLGDKMIYDDFDLDIIIVANAG